MIHINGNKNKKSVQFCIFKVFCKHMFCKLKPFKGICLMSAILLQEYFRRLFSLIGAAKIEDLTYLPEKNYPRPGL